MLKADFLDYTKIIVNFSLEVKNQTTCTKLFKCIVITGSIQNILLNSKYWDRCTFNACPKILKKIPNMKVSLTLKTLFNCRNNIAHINDLPNMAKMFSKISMQDIDNEFDTIFNLVKAVDVHCVKGIYSTLDEVAATKI